MNSVAKRLNALNKVAISSAVACHVEEHKIPSDRIAIMSFGENIDLAILYPTESFLQVRHVLEKTLELGDCDRVAVNEFSNRVSSRFELPRASRLELSQTRQVR
jgi:hypothetical protein